MCKASLFLSFSSSKANYKYISVRSHHTVCIPPGPTGLGKLGSGGMLRDIFRREQRDECTTLSSSSSSSSSSPVSLVIKRRKRPVPVGAHWGVHLRQTTTSLRMQIMSVGRWRRRRMGRDDDDSLVSLFSSLLFSSLLYRQSSNGNEKGNNRVRSEEEQPAPCDALDGVRRTIEHVKGGVYNDWCLRWISDESPAQFLLPTTMAAAAAAAAAFRARSAITWPISIYLCSWFSSSTLENKKERERETDSLHYYYYYYHSFFFCKCILSSVCFFFSFPIYGWMARTNSRTTTTTPTNSSGKETDQCTGWRSPASNWTLPAPIPSSPATFTARPKPSFPSKSTSTVRTFYLWL